METGHQTAFLFIFAITDGEAKACIVVLQK